MTRDALAGAIAAATFAVGGFVAIVAAVEDARTGRLRNPLTIGLAAIGLAGFAVAAAVGGDGARFVGVFVGAGLLCVPWFVVHLVNPEGIGFGDVKLCAGLGLYLGWLDPVLSPVTIVVSALLFAAVAIARRTARHETRPFGPALIAGAIATAVGSLLI